MLFAAIVLLGLAISSIQTTILNVSGKPLLQTAAVWLSGLLLLGWVILALQRRNRETKSDLLPSVLVGAWMVLVLLGILRGFVSADGNYWFYKSLAANSLVTSMVICVMLAQNISATAILLRAYIVVLLVGFPVVAVVSSTEGWGYFAGGLPLLVIASIYLGRVWFALLAGLSVFIAVSDLDARANGLRMMLPFLALALALFSRRRKRLQFAMTIGILAFPLVCLGLGLTGQLNVFTFLSEVVGERTQLTTYADGSVTDAKLGADTRTFLYQEVFESAEKNDYLWFGRSPARGYDTVAFRDLALVSGYRERPSSEVALLNIFTWYGAVGVVLLASIFLSAAYSVMCWGNSFFSAALGYYIAFRWVTFWIEDFTVVNLNFAFLWISVGISLSRRCMRLGDREWQKILRPS